MQKAKSASVFEFLVRVYWEDTDAGGIVFYANYLKFFERARTEWLRSLGLQQQALKTELGGMFVVTEAKLRYLRPARLDDQLCITARLHHASRTQCELHQQAWLLPAKQTHGTSVAAAASVQADAVGGIAAPDAPGAPDAPVAPNATHVPDAATATHSIMLPPVPGAQLLCEGHVHIAWVHAQQLRPQRLPPVVLQALQTGQAAASQGTT